MSQSRRTSDTLAVSIAILVLFALTQLWGESAAGATTPVHRELTSTSDLSSPGGDGSDFVARLVEPVGGWTVGDRTKAGFVNRRQIDFNDSSVLASLPDQAG